jgi:hypothetical protein
LPKKLNEHQRRALWAADVFASQRSAIVIVSDTSENGNFPSTDVERSRGKEIWEDKDAHGNSPDGS